MLSHNAPTVSPASVTAWPAEASRTSRRAAGRTGLDPALQRELSTLVDWQLWYWGQDINAPGVNALLAYGFSRTRGAEDGTQRSSAYCLTCAPVTGTSLHGLSRLLVWGFAITATPAAPTSATTASNRSVVGRDAPNFPASDGHSDDSSDDISEGNLVLMRHDRAARWCSQSISVEAGTRDRLPTATLPRSEPEARRCMSTLVAVAHCCADYEQWARSALGEAHRSESFFRRPRAARRRDAMPTFLDGSWLRVAERVAASVSFGVASPAPVPSSTRAISRGR